MWLGDYMASFMSDFSTFFNYILAALQTFWNWLFSTVLGEIILFVILISLFIYIIYLIIDFKN